MNPRNWSAWKISTQLSKPASRRKTRRPKKLFEQLETRDLMYAPLPLNYDPSIDYFPVTPALTQDQTDAQTVLNPQTDIHDGTGCCCCADCLGVMDTALDEAEELFVGSLDATTTSDSATDPTDTSLPYSVANNIQYSIPGNGDYLDEVIAAYTVTAAGMPILNSSPSSPTAIYLDFDGDSAGGYDVANPYDTDGNTATFSLSEQTDIVKAWRQVSAYFAMFDMNVTTIKPATGIETAWLAIGNNISGGYAWVGTFPTTAGASGFNNSGDARTRVSGMVHEIGHIMGLSHQSTYNTLGVKTAEYASKKDDLHGTIMGVDFDGIVKKWIWDHPSSSPSNLQDDLLVIANRVKAYQPTGGDGYRADDYGGTVALATAMQVVAGTQQIYGNIERAADVDVFSFTVSSATTQIDVVPDYPSSLDAKLEIRDAAGNILAKSHTTNNDQHLTLNLGTGTYYAYISGAGDYGDVGLYSVKVASLPSDWRSQDINSAALYLGGSGRYDSVNNTWELEGSGAGIGGTTTGSATDNFQYTSGTMTGDGTITLRVDSLENTSTSAKTGIMIRSTNANNSTYIAVAATPANGQQFLRRTTVGATASVTVSNSGAFAPIWLRVTKSGNNYSVFRSTDGSTWTQIGSTTSASLGTNFQVGVFATSATNSNPSLVKMSNFSLTGFTAPAAGSVNGLTAPTDLAVVPGTDTNLNLSWSDIAGETGYRVERSTDGMFYTTVTTTAANITSYTDTGLSGSNRYYYRLVAMNSATPSVPGNVAQAVNKPGVVTNLTFTSWTTTSIILNWRETNGETGYRIERSTDGTTYTTIATVAANTPSYTNTGLTVNTTYYYRVIPTSSLGDGTTATVSGSTRLAAVTGLSFGTVASNQVTLNWNDITNETGFQIERSTDGSTYTTLASVAAGVTTYTDSTVTAANEYYYRVVGVNASTISIYPTPIFTATPSANALPTPWAASDIGAVPGSGTTDYSGGTFKVISAGADIWGTADQFRYTYQTLTGNGTITARVSAIENTGGWAKIGVMVRESLAANSKHAMLLVSPSNGVALQYRSSTGGSSVNVSGPAVTAPYWVRMTRIGNVLTGYSSADGVTWTQVSSITISMTSTVYFGLSADANTSTLLNTSSFTNVSVTNTTPSVTNASTVVNAQNMTGLVLTPDAADGTSVTHFQITGITNGTLYQANGTTPITEGQFITIAQGAAGLKFLPAANSTATGSFQAKASLSNTVSGLSGNAVTATISVSPLTGVESTVINGGLTGGAQRSMVKNLTVTFTGLVTIQPGAFVVTQQPSGTAVTVAVAAATVGGKTVATLTFSGAATENGSLMDGNYQLSINGALIKDSLGYSIDADANQTVGGTRLFGQGASTAATDKFFRLFGDYDGDRDVDNSDLLRFRTTQNRLSSDALFLWFMDFEQDGDVDNTDLLRFRLRLNTTLS